MDAIHAAQFLQAGAEAIGLEPFCPVLFEGSLAEGMGNSTSDVDFLVIVEDGDERLSMPSVLFVLGRRVEFRFRSARQILARARRLERDAGAPAEADVDEWHRFSHGQVLRGETVMAGLREALPRDRFNAIAAAWQAGRAWELAQAGRLFAELDDPAAAERSFHRALTYAAKAWLAKRGSTYVEEKWLEHQLLAEGAAEPVVARTLSALARPHAERDWPELLTALHPGLAFHRLADLYPKIGRSVTTWRIGELTHVISERTAVFILSDDCAATWRSLRRSRTFGEAVDLGDATVRKALLGLWKCGLLAFSARRGAAKGIGENLHLWVEAASCPDRISVRGETKLDGPIGRYRQSARAFVLAGLGLVWENILIENALEDAQGARSEGQGGVLITSIERIVVSGCRSMLLSRGVVPAPAGTDAVAALRGWSGGGDAARSAARKALEIATYVASGKTDAAWTATLDFIRLVREDGSFPRSFATREEWRDTMGVGYDWVRLGAYMGSDFPTAETREIVAKSGQ